MLVLTTSPSPAYPRRLGESLEHCRRSLRRMTQEAGVRHTGRAGRRSTRSITLLVQAEGRGMRTGSYSKSRVSYLYMFNLSSYPVWMGPVLGRPWTISTARSNWASMSWRESTSMSWSLAWGYYNKNTGDYDQTGDPGEAALIREEVERAAMGGENLRVATDRRACGRRGARVRLAHE